MARSLASITKRLAKRHAAQKKAKEKLEEDRNDFFEAATAELAQRQHARKTVELPAYYEDRPAEYIAQYFPGWVLLSVDNTGDEVPDRALIEEDPSFMKFVFVNKETKQTFQRTVRQGSLALDDERLRQEMPDLWEAISEEVRVPKSLDDLTPEQLSDIQPYLVRGKPSLSLGAPRSATEEELVDAG